MRLTEADRLPVQQTCGHEAPGHDAWNPPRDHVEHLSRSRLADTEDEHHLIRGYD